MLYTPAEAATQTGRSIEHITEAIRTGDLRATRTRIEGEHLRAWARWSALAAALHVTQYPVEVVADAC